MADYREISQQYAQGGIKAAAVLKGGAAIALLSQAADLLEKGFGDHVSKSLSIWAAGIVVSALTWMVAFLSTRHVDRSEQAGRDQERGLRISDRYMTAGVVLVAISIALFVWGAWVLSSNLGGMAAAPS